MAKSLGTLYIVATPIGNLNDISLRALEILKTVSWILAEDTRYSQTLLKHFGIATPLKSLHEHNEAARVNWILEELTKGHDLALVSDAGTPLISDPGFVLVKALSEKGCHISPVPGACAAIAALSVSGLPSDHFVFVGFLPAKSSARKIKLETFLPETGTLIFYEAPHRLMESLQDMIAVFGEKRVAVVARELTKTFEELQRGSLATLHAHFLKNSQTQRGEFVILVHGAAASDPSIEEARRILTILLRELPIKTAAQIAAEITGLRKNELYNLALRINS